MKSLEIHPLKKYNNYLKRKNELYFNILSSCKLNSGLCDWMFITEDPVICVKGTINNSTNNRT